MSDRFIRWLNKPVPYYCFWHPNSGVRGALALGLLIITAFELLREAL